MRFLLALFTCMLFSTKSFASIEVIIGKTKVLEIHQGVGEFTIEERAKAVKARIKGLSTQKAFSEDKLIVRELSNVSSVFYENRPIISINDADAEFEKRSRKILANEFRTKIIKVISEERSTNSIRKIALSVTYTLISTLLLVLLLAFISKFFPVLVAALQRWSTNYVPSIKISSYELLPASRLISFLIWLARASRLILTLLLIYFYLPLVFSFFPGTSHWAGLLYGYISNPISQITKVIVGFVPNLFFIAIIVIFTNYFLKFIHFIFSEIERGSIKFSGFYPDWAIPTYKLVRFLVLAFSVIIIFPYLPGAGSPAFQGVSVFLGILFSIGSSSAIANIVSGVVLTYMRPFKVGDRVKISDTIGDVVAKNLLVTRVRTTKNVDVTVPNAMVLGSHLINYSSSAKDSGLILHTTITIGYDVDWRIVHQLLVDSALSVEMILKTPNPFILQTSLDDFYVSYELNAYTNSPNKMSAIYSEIHKNIQEKFAEAEVEIMSPHFSAHRDGSHLNIPVKEGESAKFVPAIRVDKGNLS